MSSRAHTRRLRLTATSSSGASTVTPTRTAVVERPTKATEGVQPTEEPASASSARRGSRKHGSRKKRAAKAAAAHAEERLPHALPGRVVWREPRTCFARQICELLFPLMLPMADFSLDKCAALRAALVPRLERLEHGAGVMAMMQVLGAVEAEMAVQAEHPERHPEASSTAFVRFISAYTKDVEAADDARRGRHYLIKLLMPRTKIYIEFVNHLFGHGSALAQLAATALQAAWRGYASRGRRMAGRLGA